MSRSLGDFASREIGVINEPITGTYDLDFEND